MISIEKKRLILKEGNTVIVTKHDGSTFSSKALIGRASKQFNNIISLEENRRGMFLPETNIDNGYIVNDTVTNETYLVIAIYKETFSGLILSTAAHMFKCNSIMTVSGESMTADLSGNIRKSDTVKVNNLPICLEQISVELRQYDPGLHPDAQYVIYTSYLGTLIMDKITIANKLLKVIDVDNITFKNISVIQVRTETRI